MPKSTKYYAATPAKWNSWLDEYSWTIHEYSWTIHERQSYLVHELRFMNYSWTIGKLFMNMHASGFILEIFMNQSSWTMFHEY